MATDNDALLKNRDAERSLFGLRETNRTSQPLGQIGVVDCQFANAKDTIKHRHGVHYELKPTTDVLNTSIRSNIRNFAVPMRSIWAYAAEFISKGNEYIPTGGFNTPYIQTKEGQSNMFLPTCNPTLIMPAMLAMLGSGNPNGIMKFAEPGNSASTSHEYQGNVQDYIWGRIHNGQFGFTKAEDEYVDCWWLPRLLGSGRQSRYMNMNVLHAYNVEPSRQNSFWQFSTKDPDMLLSAEGYGFLAPSHFADPYLCCNVWYSNIYNKTYFFMYWADGATNATYTYAPSISLDPAQWTFAMDMSLVPTLNDASVGVNDHPAPLYGDADDTKWYQLFHSKTLGALTTDECRRAYNLALLFFFRRPELFGQSSLCEQLGVHFFERRNFFDLSTDTYHSHRLSVDDGAVLDASYWAVNSHLEWTATNEVGPDSEIRICTLPFYAYQKALSDRFLLRHETLTNNMQETSEVDTSLKYDSPFFRNNMVPTMSFYHQVDDVQLLEDELRMSLVVSEEGWVPAGYLIDKLETTEASLPQEYWKYVMSLQQFLSIFLNRNCLMQMDVLTKIWQRENHNVQALLDKENLGVVDTDRRVDLKKFLLSKSFTRFIRKGGIDQMASKVIEDIYGINDVPCDKNMAVLLSDQHHIIATQDVVNQGGATDQYGSQMALGQRVSIASETLEVANDYDCFCPEYTFFLTLHWMDCEVVRAKVPNFATSRLGWAYRTRRAFQLAFFPMYQSLGDDALFLEDIEFGADANLLGNTMVGWTNKNFLLKDSDINRVGGEFLDKYCRQLVSSTPTWKQRVYGPSLTYGGRALIDRGSLPGYQRLSNFEYRVVVLQESDCGG